MPAPFNPQKHRRRSIRLHGYDYTQPGAYFITICTHEHMPLFGEISNGEMRLNRTGKITREEWSRLPERFPFLECGPFVVMPNHIHGILIIRDRDCRGTAEDEIMAHERRGTAADGEATIEDGIRRGTAEDVRAMIEDESSRARTIGNREAAVMEESSRAPTRIEQFSKPVPGSIPTIVRSFKSSVTRRTNRASEHSSVLLWQRNYYEHVVRDEADYERIEEYIQNNPRRWDEDEINPRNRS